MKVLPVKLKDFMNIMASIEDRQDRMNLLIDYAEKFIEVPEEIATRPFPRERAVPFCESEAYVFSRLNKKNTINFYYAVENPQGISAKALCAIFESTLEEESPETILNIPNDIILEIFGHELSMGKNMGLTGILQMMQRDAKQSLLKPETSAQN
jgi:cysteine desulfuration protein SufE